MCLITYTHYSCGHTAYTVTRIYPPLDNPCPLPSLDNDLWKNISHDVVVAEKCKSCNDGLTQLPSYLPEIDPYLKTIFGIALLLRHEFFHLTRTLLPALAGHGVYTGADEKIEDAMIRCGFALKQIKVIPATREKLGLLERLGDLYPFCKEMKPTKEEMGRWIRGAVTDFGKIRNLVQQIRDAPLNTENRGFGKLGEEDMLPVNHPCLARPDTSLRPTGGAAWGGDKDINYLDAQFLLGNLLHQLDLDADTSTDSAETSSTPNEFATLANRNYWECAICQEECFCAGLPE